MEVPDQGFKATSVAITTTSMMMTSSITGSSTATAADGADGAAA